MGVRREGEGFCDAEQRCSIVATVHAVSPSCVGITLREQASLIFLIIFGAQNLNVCVNNNDPLVTGH